MSLIRQNKIPAMNVVIVGDEINAEYFINSKYVSKLYFAPKDIKFNTFRELSEKCKALQADLVLVQDEKWILQGIGDVLRQNNVNCIAPTSNWTKLGINRPYVYELLDKYNFHLPQKIILPNEFPVLIRGAGLYEIANTLDDIVRIKENIYNKSADIAQTIYLEEYLGKYEILTSLFDGKHLITFKNDKFDYKLIKNYNDQLEELLNSEKANFLGFINSLVVQKEDYLYNIGFNFEYPEEIISTDLMYVLNLALYQKLNEFKI